MRYFPEQTEFEEIYNKGESQLVWTEFLTDLETPVSAMLKLMGISPYHLLFESVEGGKTRARYSIIALDPDLLWRCIDGTPQINRTPDSLNSSFETAKEPDPFVSLRKLIKESEIKIPDELPPMAAGIFGYMGYDMVRYMEKLPDNNPDNINIPESIYMRPKITVIFDNILDKASIITIARNDSDENAETSYEEAKNRINNIVELLNTSLKRTIYSKYYADNSTSEIEFKSHISKEKYMDMVSKSKEYIVAGDVFQVLPSRRMSAKFILPPFALYRSLRHLNPSPYLFYLNLDGFSLIGSSPEILVGLRNEVVTIRPLAGTRKRGKDQNEDLALEKELLSDEKELAEHLMLLDLGRNDVGRVTKTGTVRVTEQMKVERYSHVMHIVSNVEGDILNGKDCIDALIAGFPAGTVTGAPKIRAMEIIDELEPEKRSFYSGTVGYISGNGNMDTCIALRTGLVKDDTLYVQAGGGVVADSSEEGEYKETEVKAQAIISAAKMAGKFV